MAIGEAAMAYSDIAGKMKVLEATSNQHVQVDVSYDLSAGTLARALHKTCRPPRKFY